MSDDEMQMPGGMGMEGMEGMDDMSDDDAGDAELPEGVQKEVVTAAPDGNWKMPKKGDEVTVHYVGTLEADGSEFDSSRSRDKPFVFTLGQGQVIKGWDLGVATMKKGEVAKFTLAPEFAYGDAGSPPKIPEKATLVFEVELISWVSKDDLFGDEGVIKTQVTEGSGWRTPKIDGEVLVTVKAESPDGSSIAEHTDLEYVIGSDSLGPIAKACDKALQGMKVGEEAQLKCSKDYAFGDRTPEGATVTIKLSQIYETKDVSFESDKSVMKKQVVEGEGYETPKDGAKVTLAVDAATDGSSALPGFTAKTLEFLCGNGDVCDALECAVASMKKGEKAIVSVAKAAQAAESQLGLASVASDKVQLTVRLEDFEKVKETWSMSEDEKLEFGAARKEVGATLFKSGRFVMALQRYKKVAEMFSYVDNFKEENKAKAKELKKLCNLNKAACYLKMDEHFEAKGACDSVLKDDSQNVKATFRRAQAHFGMKNFLDCIQDCKKVVELDAQNREARLLLKRAQEGQKEEDKKSKGLFATMCKALGKGPIPEPFKEKRRFDDEDDEGDMEEPEDKDKENQNPAAEVAGSG